MNYNNEKILATLNDAQLKAVTAPLENNLLVLAGAGSGKTRVLIHRIWWLLQHGVSCHNILAVTFTNKASQEMKNRLEEMLHLKLDQMWVGTFHSLTHRLLRIHWLEANLPQSFQVMDSDDQLRILRRIHKALTLDEEKWPVKNSQSFINSCKDKCQRAKDIPQNFTVATLLRVYKEYEDLCARGGLVDFSELILRAYELLLRNEELRVHYRNRFQYIFADEFQDTNSLQYLFIKLLTKDSGKLMAVGDDDQSIYSWRGADSGNMQQLTLDFPRMEIIKLEQNYRSTGNILKAANAVIQHNESRLGKNLWTSGEQGEKITLYSAFNEMDEANYISNSIENFCRRGHKFSDIAVLYRSNAQSRVLENQLTRLQIPYIIYGGLRFYDRAEIKDTLAYLRLAINKNDDAAFERIVNVPTRGIGETTLIALRDYVRESQISLWSAAKEMLENKKFNSRAANSLQGFISLIESIAKEITNLELSDIVDYAAKVSGLKKHFAEDKTERGQAKVENIEELVVAAKQFAFATEAKDNADLLNLFLAHIFLESTEESRNIDTKDNVSLMTLHAAKGLEFPIVFISGMEEGLFPHAMSLEPEDKLEEERRLCYVGMTRAMKKLHLLHAHSRQLYGNSSHRLASRFLREIPSNLIEQDGGNFSVTRPVSFQNQYNNISRISSPTAFCVSPDTKNGQYQLGQKVFHDKFGEGIIIGFEGSDDKMLLQIKFARFGSKWLASAVAKLKVV